MMGRIEHMTAIGRHTGTMTTSQLRRGSVPGSACANSGFVWPASQLGSAARILSCIAAGLLILCLLAVAVPRQAEAQGSGSYIPPFPSNDTYKLYVFGDSLAEGTWAGLYRAFRNDPQLQIVKKSRPGSGLARVKNYNWLAAAERFVQAEEFQIAVVVFGISDRKSVWVNGNRHRFATSGWHKEYARRVDRFIKTLKRKRAAIYWVGLPIMAGDRANSGAQLLNNLYRERSFRNGIRYIDTWNSFADQNGQYSAYGPDLSGTMRRLRADDGVHFTMRGYHRLAQLVEREVRRDLTLANAQRNVPLAGNDEEQKRIRERAQRRLARVNRQATAVRRRTVVRRAAPKEDFGALDYKAEHTTIELKVTNQAGATEALEIPILRPAIPSAVVSHIRRRSRSSRATSVGQDLRVDLSGGQTVVSSITPLNEGSGPGGRRNVPVTQTPYYKVLVKGERLSPKPGRADDFRWPKPGAGPSG